VEKVVELLDKLQAKVEQEGKEEAAAYDKYACFCKEQVDEKQYTIEKSDKKIEKLSAEIEKLSGEISALDGEIGELAKKITKLEEESKIAQDRRDKEHEVYMEKEADAAGAIDACERAIAALKESKAQLKGKAQLEGEALAQVRSVARLALASKAALSEERMHMLSALAQPGAAYESTYHSNDIIATIEDLRLKFKSIKERLDQEEFDANAMHDKKQLALKNEIKFAEKEKAEKTELAEAKREEKEAKEGDKTQETADRNADKSFQDVLVTECQEKAQLWDQRSAARSAELTAISEAMAALKSGVAPNWKANKKLSGIQRQQRVTKGRWVYVEDSKPASFLQEVQAHGSVSRDAAVAEKVRALLQGAGAKLRSPVLAIAALKVTLSEDHFVKVRGLIKDLIARLQEQAAEERTQKETCDKGMKSATEKRDKEQSNVESAKASISETESTISQLKEEIAELSKAIAENKKALKEATALREQESAENEKTVAEAEAGKLAVAQAIEVLKQFYEGAAFVQYVPPNSDREGKTVSDRAPEIFDSEYKGSQDASKGIIGMLEVIESDFDRTVTTVKAEEEEAQTAFETFKEENEKDTETKEKSVETKEGEITTLEDKLVGFETDLKSAEEEHASALKELEVLHSMCIAPEETHEERVQKREQEIEALKQAHDILENWQG